MPVLAKCITAYKLWQEYLIGFPKTSKYSLGGKIDALFLEAIEAITTAVFLQKQEKIPYVRRAIAKLDTVNVFTQIAWEIRSLDTKKYIALAEALHEPGKMLGGWHNQLIKQNSPTIKIGEK